MRRQPRRQRRPSLKSTPESRASAFQNLVENRVQSAHSKGPLPTPERTFCTRQCTGAAVLNLPQSIGLNVMKTLHRATLATLLLASWTCAAAEQPKDTYFLRLPPGESNSLGQVDRLVVKVACGWISALRNVPELYNVNMGYDMPSENVLEAQPRLGAAAVELPAWSGVIGVRLPSDADRKSCFKVTVTVEGRSGETREWDGSQLGLPR